MYTYQREFALEKSPSHNSPYEQNLPSWGVLRYHPSHHPNTTLCTKPHLTRRSKHHPGTIQCIRAHIGGKKSSVYMFYVSVPVSLKTVPIKFWGPAWKIIVTASARVVDEQSTPSQRSHVISSCHPWRWCTWLGRETINSQPSLSFYVYCTY